MRIPPASSRPALAAVIAAVALASLAGCQKPKPAPPIDQLTEALQHTAEKELAAPSLANEQVILTASAGRAEAETAMVVKAASAAGGVAIPSLNAEGQPSILATIPENNAGAFKAAIQQDKSHGNPSDNPAMTSPSANTTLIEILIKSPGASASPAGSPTP